MSNASLLRTVDTLPAIDATTRCRYKTGRCTNARVVKPNGSLLLLCEFHRDQQNRTKKRSDMKYRHHRAKKRQLEKHSDLNKQGRTTPLHVRPTANSRPHPPPQPSRCPSPTTTPSLTAPLVLASSQMSLDAQPRSPVVCTPTMLTSTVPPLHTPVAALAKRETTTFTKAAVLRLSSGVPSAHSGVCISPAKARLPGLMASTTFSSRRNRVAMDSPATKTPLSLPYPPLVSPHVAPLCLSPLQTSTSSAWGRMWPPEDLQLLEYFIM